MNSRQSPTDDHNLNRHARKKNLFGYTLNIFRLQKTDIFLMLLLLTFLFIGLAFTQTRHLLAKKVYTGELKNYEKILIQKKNLEEQVSKLEKPFASESAVAPGWQRIKIINVPIVNFSQSPSRQNQ